ncbi:histone-lysine N-methyltransferase ASHR3-like [Tripterygium wilfordii]|uniref:Histone-lysine N-methyltransferase ASHR3-like n=1 Tax=Tripterygium wilfordii TaxID=458696 RepID=A0A7J7BVP3_TRIWF|nr:histone-lysine N-methyltransferase ASHR3-like [Tripterygium wilfordii]
MADPANLSAPSSSLPPDDLPNSKSPPSAAQADSNLVEIPTNNADGDQLLQSPRENVSNESDVRGFGRGRGLRKKGLKMEDHVRVWTERKMESGVPESQCVLPFLVGSSKMGDCVVCNRCICPGEEVVCSVRGCGGICHPLCAAEEMKTSNQNSFKCPHHACFLCKQKPDWRCTQCSMASHDKCACWPEKFVHQENQPEQAICWRHPKNWRQANQVYLFLFINGETFSRLPLPYVDEEFKIDLSWKELIEKEGVGPSPYVPIKRNIYLVKKKREARDKDNGCVDCDSSCSGRCDCRIQCLSCSKSCHCGPESCTNRPFRNEKKMSLVKTELCGWGVEAAEPLNKGDFIIEYVGEVIDDALCEKRLWDMKHKGAQNFYLFAIGKDLTIDATFKGNASRFINHSCAPNCVMEKWQVDGETRIGVFAARSIKVGEQLTYLSCMEKKCSAIVVPQIVMAIWGPKEKLRR